MGVTPPVSRRRAPGRRRQAPLPPASRAGHASKPESGWLLDIRQRHPSPRLDLRRLRQMVSALLEALLDQGGYQMAVHLVGTTEMIQLNETYLKQAGPTDVISFDYRVYPSGEIDLGASGQGRSALRLQGEVFVCVAEAVSQAKRFHTTWEQELVRYIIHGMLHLMGFDDRQPAERTRLRRLETRWLGFLKRRFPLSQLGGRN